MKRNKYMEEAGLYALIEEKNIGKLKDEIEESVSSLHHWNGDGGELQASEAYSTIIRDAPPKAVGGGIKMLSAFLQYDKDRSYKSDAGRDAQKMCSDFLVMLKEVPEDLWEYAIEDAINASKRHNYYGDVSDVSKVYEKASSLPPAAKEKAISDLKELKGDNCSMKAALVDSYKILSDTFEGDLLLKKISTIRKLYRLSDKLVDEAKSMAIEHIKKGG